MAIITLARATELIPNFPSADTSVMQDCVNAASDTIERWCNRTFSVQTYDELYSIDNYTSKLRLNNYPIVSISRISFLPTDVLQIRMTDQIVSRASFRLDGWTPDPVRGDYAAAPANLYLVSMKNGIETDITINLQTGATTVNGTPGSTFTMITLGDLATAINSFSAYGWYSLALGIYSTWPVADLRPPQGAFECKWYGSAYLKLHSGQLPAYGQNPDTGEIVSTTAFTPGSSNYRVIYTAGYATIPNPVQQACASLAVSVYQSRGQNSNLTSESLGGYSYSQTAERSFHQLDIASRYGLSLYKCYSIPYFK